MSNATRSAPRLASAAWSALFFLSLIILWQLALPLLDIPKYLPPTPLGIAEECGKRGGLLLAHALPTFNETVLGFLLGIVVGIGSGLGIVYSRFLWLTIYPSLIVLASIPRIAVAPLILIWFGIDSGDRYRLSWRRLHFSGRIGD